MADLIIKYRWLIIGFFLTLGALSGLLLPMAKTDPEIRNYVPSTMNSRIETDKIEGEFGVQDMVVILFSDSCILTEYNLNQIKEIDRSVSKIPGVSTRISPFTIRSIKGEDGMMVAERLIKEIPVDTTSMRMLGEEILNNRFARDIVFSSDLTSATITATIDSNEPETETLHRIDSVIVAHPGHAKIITGGLPYIRQHIMKDVRKDGLLLIPVALLIILLMLKLALGEWRSVLMPFSIVILSTVISMGLIPLLGWKMSILSLLVPIILVAVANNYGIYLVARFQEISSRAAPISGQSMVKEILGSLNMPIIFSGLTTIAGILGLLAHSIIPARQVGILAATGVALSLMMSLLVIPALIFIRGPIVNGKKGKSLFPGLFARFLGKLSRLVVRYPGRILIISVIITLLLSIGIFILRIDTNQENYFPKNHPVRIASGIINSKFGGSQTISVMVTGDIKNPEVMNGIDALTLQLEKQKGVGKVFSISQVIREMSKAIFDKNEQGYDRIPGSTEAIAQMFELYNMSGDQSDFKQIMNLDNSKAHVLVRLSDPSNSVIKAVKEIISDTDANFPAKLTMGGYAIIMSDFAGSIIKGQVFSLIFALVTVFVLLTIIFRSVKGGLTGIIPLAGSIFILFGFMGITGIALDGATALLSSIMIGVGVDFTIQYIWCFKSHIMKGLSYPDATVAAIGTIGRSIIINAVSVMAGFSALMLSGFTSIRFFGYLVLISIGSCLVGAILIVPAFLVRFKPRFIEMDLSKLKRRKHESKSDLIDVITAAFSGNSTTT